MKPKAIGLTILVGVLVIGSVILASCQSAPPATPSPTTLATGVPDLKPVEVDGGVYTDISVQKLHSLLDQKDFVLINVHTPFEGNLPQTDQAVAYDTIGQNLDKLPNDKNAKIVLYCRSGRMSTIAAKELVKLGYTNVLSLSGGMAAWEQAGYSILK